MNINSIGIFCWDKSRPLLNHSGAFVQQEHEHKQMNLPSASSQYGINEKLFTSIGTPYVLDRMSGSKEQCLRRPKV
ncbi:hypothetical protein DPMN_076593 [Dreissena polymorpha]|uniref:Uncharacterized protein n=1 Tax=Dreissena polymorpha TaxID=45954 RepID=A0A9D3YMN4_DREPO|nr:hypothetical protein DPMN_076593 [Dreissena polymorpha]